MDWFRRWRQYEAKVWRNAWGRTETAGKKVMSTGVGIIVSVGLGAILLGAALELRSVLPLLTAAVLFLGTLCVNLLLAPSRLDKESQDNISTEKQTSDELRKQLERKRVERETYEALRTLHQEGERLLMEFGKPNVDSWDEQVVSWRTRVYELLPFERDGFLTMSSPQVWKAAPHGAPKMELFTSQLAKLRHIFMRLENEVDGWEPGKR
jgi:hypothetical protein